MIDANRESSRGQRSFDAQIGVSIARKLKAGRDSAPGVWFGLGVMGVVGWSVVVPTLLGAALGHWLDSHHWSGHSWTLPLLVAGLSVGCLNAGFWVAKETRNIRGTENDFHA